MIQFSTHLPDARLTPYIRMYFWGKDDTPPMAQRIVPNGEMGLCFYRGNSVVYDGFGNRNDCVSGQMLRYQDVLATGGIEIVGVHFTALGAHLFFRMTLNELFGQTISLDDLDDRELTTLRDQVMEASSHEACWRLMDGFFTHRMAEVESEALNFKRLQRAISYGMHHLSDVLVRDVASEACLSERHFSRLFSEIVGLPPKDYLRLQRFRKTLGDLKQSMHTSTETMTEVAWKNGYCDFSHLSSDFRKITGYSPRQLLELSTNNNDEVGWRL